MPPLFKAACKSKTTAAGNLQNLSALRAESVLRCSNLKVIQHQGDLHALALQHPELPCTQNTVSPALPACLYHAVSKSCVGGRVRYSEAGNA